MAGKLALDLGTKLGWCRGDRSGTHEYRKRKHHGPGARFLSVLWFLQQEHRREPITEIHYEYVRRHEGILAAHVYGGIQAVVTMWAEENLVEVHQLSVQEIKRTWTGAGNASKKMMVAEARRRGLSPTTEDEADAMATWHARS